MSGSTPPLNIHFQERGAPHKVEFPLDSAYESIEFNLANGQTDYDLSVQQITAFITLGVWTSVFIRTDKDISIKLNSSSNHTISIREYESPFHLRTEIEITNIYLTNNSGATAAIKLLAFNRTRHHA